MRLTFILSSLLLSLILAGGCATTDKTPANLSGGPGVQAGNSALNVPQKDKVLWQYRNALAALRKAQFEEAKRLLDDAILSIGGIITNDKSAKKARGYFSSESKKNFIGEPYERIMAYYYRGILYWMDGEPDNARACFRTGQLLDSDSENKEYANDFYLLEYLEGLASAKMGDDSADAFKRAQGLSKRAAPPAYDPKANVLVFVDFGSGPKKFAAGEHSEQLKFRHDFSNVRQVAVKAGTQNLALLGPQDDLYFQATTRGGRVMDHILANKAVFKSATDTAGNAAIISGAVLAHNRGSQEAGLGILAAGIVSKIVSAATTPSADTRCWDNLPQYLTFAAVQLPPGQHSLVFEFRDENGRPLPSATKTVQINVPANQDKVLYVSDKSATPLTL